MTLSINGKTYDVNELVAYHKRLEEENAELKKTVLQFQKDSYCGMCHFKTKAQLTKAKEIIKKYYEYNPSCEYFYEDIDKEAEQFLSEVEK